MESVDRRKVMLLAGLGVAGIGCGERSPAEGRMTEKEHEGGDEDVAPPEDLMREHGVLNRLPRPRILAPQRTTTRPATTLCRLAKPQAPCRTHLQSAAASEAASGGSARLWT
jgi:hypothetical protein